MDRKNLARAQKRMLGEISSIREGLLKLPNVVAVGVGLKETGGEFTDEIAFRVFVREKLDPAQLSDKDLVPQSVGGFKTDVLPPLRIANDAPVCGNERRTLSRHRPLQAGIAVSTTKNTYGTLGWFATLDADDTRVLLTNKHVLWDDTDEVVTDNLKTAQPQLDEPSTCCCCECGDDNVIGETLLGVRNMSPLTDTSVDAAVARIDSGLASNISLTITNDSTDEVLIVSGTAAATVGETVRKIGARSGFTRGTVIHVGDLAAAPADPGGGTVDVRTGQVLVIPLDDETYEVRDEDGVCKRAFSNGGDSGAVIVNDADEIIALNWGGNTDDYSVKLTVASNIDDVLTALSDNGFPITILTSPGGGEGAFLRSDAVASAHARARATNVPTAPTVGPNIFERLRDSNRQSLLAWLYDRHHREVLRLIDERRAVTVAWHRARGPAYVAALSRSSRVEHYRVPFEIDGTDRAALLRAMEAALMAHGSEMLKNDIRRYRDELMTLAFRWRTIAELADELRRCGLLDHVPELEVPAHTGT
ncbi:MAG: hypothetical protein ACREQ8_18045 [Woeseiaceae bacterium]